LVFRKKQGKDVGRRRVRTKHPEKHYSAIKLSNTLGRNEKKITVVVYPGGRDKPSDAGGAE